MKKFVLLSLIALALCAFPANMRADDVCHTIGSDTTTGPMFDRHLGSSSFQMIFTKEELTAAGVRPGYIDGITFNWHIRSGVSAHYKDFEIHIGATDKDFFESGNNYENESAFTLCYEGSIPSTLSEGEQTYTFNKSSFAWDGNSNIVVAAIVNQGYEETPATFFTAKGSNCDSYRCLYLNDKNKTFSVGDFSTWGGNCTFFRPVISFCQDYCPVVTNLTASDVSYTSATISWDACASCTNGFDVVCSTSPVTDFSTATIQHVTTNSLNLTNLDEYTDYYVYVRSCCGIYSDWSQALHFKTLLDCTAPENVTITDVRKHRMTLNWNTSPKATSYDIIVSTTALANPSSAEVTYPNVTGSSKVLDNLSRETKYYLYIRANCVDQHYSEWVSDTATTPPLECSGSLYETLADGGHNNIFFPISGSYVTNPQKSQSIYPESMLADLVGVEIHRLKYFVRSGGSQHAEYDFMKWGDIQFKVRMMTTSQSTLSGIISTTGATCVYTGALTANVNNSGVMSIELDTPFIYTGGNLLIEFEQPSHTEILGNATSFYGANQDNNVSFFHYPTNTAMNQCNGFLPKVEFMYCQYIPCPTLNTAPIATAVAHDAATITWNDSPDGNALSYDMIVSESEISDFTNVAPMHENIDTTSHRLTGLEPNTEYYVYVRVNCVNGDISEGSSLWSPVCQFRTLNNITDVENFEMNNAIVVGGVTIDAENHTITATVHKSTDLTNVSFTIGLAEGCTAKYKGEDLPSSLNFSSTDTVRVYAEDVALYQDWTITITKELCATPYNVRLADIQKYQMRLDWDNLGADQSDNYDIVVSKTTLDDPSTVAATYSGVTGNSRDIDSLDRNTTYYVYLRNNCGGNNVTEWVSDTATTSNIENPECPCPAVSTPRVESITPTSATITWDAGAGDFATTYDIIVSETEMTGEEARKDTSLQATSYDLTSLTPNTTYYAYVRVNCVNDHYNDGSSQWSPAGVFRTLNNVTDITSLSFNSDVEVGSVIIDNDNHTISATVGFNTDLTNLPFTLTLVDSEHGIAKYNGGGLPQSLDFTDPVTVVVYAEDRNISQEWTISIVNETCATPYNLTVTGVTEREATLNWNLRDQTATSFDIVVSKEPLDAPSTGVIQDTTATNNAGVCTYPLDHLTSDTHYYIYIRTDCGTETSHWSSVEFSTMSVLDCNSTQPVVVAEGTVENEKFPVYGLYCDHSQKTQSIYPASMLKGLLGNKISKLKYFVQSGGSSSNTGNWENATFKIRMMTTDKSTFSSVLVSTADVTPVYSDTLRASVQNGMEITLIEPFDYTGGNLLIEFELPVATSWTICSFYGIEADGNVSGVQMYDHPDLSKFLPKVEFTTCEKVSACPEVTNVAATNIGDTSATITWTASTGPYANTSDIYYSTTEVEDFTGIEPQIKNITGNSQQITGLTLNTTYYVYVRTHCDKDGYDDGISGWAGTSFLTLAPCRIPGSLTPTVTGKHTATVAWTNTSGGSQDDNFTYILSTTPIAEDALETTATGVKTTSVDLTNLQSDTTYYFYLKNVCTDVNCSSPWVSCQFTTPIAMPAVINLQAHDIAHNAFTATWESDSANFANETEWEVACVAHGETPTTWTQVSVPEYFIFGLNEKTTYDFYVRAKSGSNHSANAILEVTTIQKSTEYDCMEVIVSENGTVNQVPVRTIYMGSYTVQIYTADELSAVGCSSGDIEKIAFYQTECVNTSDASRYHKKTTVWMGNTNKETFDNNQDWIHGLTKVMNEKPIDFNKNGDWVELQLDEPFRWDGTSNLAVAVLAYSDNFTSMKFAGGSVESNRSIYSYADEASWTVTDGVPSHTDNVSYYSSQLANIKLCFEPASCRSVDKLKVDDITFPKARAHWYPGDAETTWHVYNSTTEMTNDALAALTSSDYSEVTDNPEYNISGLNPNNDYYLYVRAVCGDDEQSRWRKYRYATPLLCSAPTEAVAYSQADSSITFTATAVEVGTVGSYDYRYWVAGAENSAVTVSGGETLSVTGLTAGGTYEWEVRANCGTNEGSSRWVKGNTVHLCGTATLPYYSNFDQYGESLVPDCWTVTNGSNNSILLGVGLDLFVQNRLVLIFRGNSSIATQSIKFPAGDAKISLSLMSYMAEGYGLSGGQMRILFASDIYDPSTYTLIYTFAVDMFNNPYYDADIPVHFDTETTGYIVLDCTTSSSNSSLAIDRLNIETYNNDDDCGEELIVGYNGASMYTHNGNVPIESRKASYSVQIYTANELIAQGYQAGDISSIAFYQTVCDNTSDSSCYRKKTTVWMGNTTKETFENEQDWIYGLKQVKNARPIDFNKNGAWVDLPLDTPFYWDGEGNIAVAVLAYSDNSTEMYFRGSGYMDVEYRAIVTCQDDYEPTGGSVPLMENTNLTKCRANIKLCYAAGTCPVVTGIKVDNITTTSATARWTAGGGETAWHVYNSPTRLTNVELAALDQVQRYTVVNTNPEICLNNLIKDSDYYLYVRAACGADDVSRWKYYKYSTLPTCSAPVSPNATSEADNSITFTANHRGVGTEGTYDYRYWISGSENTVDTVSGGNSVKVSGLSGDNDYEWEVRANCSGTGEGSSRWVKGNTVHVCGAVTLPYFNAFEQYELYSVPDCWTIVDTVFDSGMTTVPFPCMFSLPDQFSYILFVANSSIATPLIDVPNEGIRISFDLLGMSASSSPMNVMFATNLADTSTYRLIDTFDLDENFLAQNMVTLFNPQGVSTQGYIIFKLRDGEAASMLSLGNLLIEAMPTSNTKNVTVDKVTYTISGLLQGNNVTIEKVSFDENDLTEADFDITYNNTFLNYKHKLDVPTTLTDVIKDRYKVVAIKLDAFNDVDLTKNVRVNVPAGMNIVGSSSIPNNKIVVKDSETGILYNGNSYTASKAYKVNIHDSDASLAQRPFGEKPLKINYLDGAGIETEIGTTKVFKTEGVAQFKYEEGAWTEQSQVPGKFEATLNEDEVTIDVGRRNTIRVDTNARYNGTFDLTFCDELKFQSDNVNRSYPDCQLTGNMPLGDSTKVKAELSLNNKEYYYFSLPFDCDDFKVMAGDTTVERSSSIDEAIYSADAAVHHYVLFRWNESAYNDSAASGYVAYSGTRLEKNRGYVIAIVESAGWYDTYWNVDGASLDVTATFTASDDYKQVASSESEIEIPVTRADAANAYSGWNLVGNPFYNQVKSSQYSFNNYEHKDVKYVRKVEHDYGSSADVKDYASEIPDFNVDIKPFETVFIQKSDIDGDGTVTVSGTSPVQPVQGAPAILPEYVTITLNDSSRMIDRTTIINNVLSSDDYLQEEDLVKSHQGSNEIYTQYGDYDFSFNEMNISDTDKTIPLAVKVAAEGDYTIAMSSGLSNYGTGQVFLHDKTLETYMKLSDGEVETLHLTEGVTEDRLELVIKVDEVITIADDAGDETDGIEVYVHDGIATIEGVEEGAIVTITDATGKTLYMSEATGNRMDYQFTVRGVYMITVRNNANVNTVKVVY